MDRLSGRNARFSCRNGLKNLDMFRKVLLRDGFAFVSGGSMA